MSGAHFPGIHGVIGTMVMEMIESAMTPERCQHVESLVMGYLGHLVGAGVAGDLALDMGSALMGDTLTWLVKVRQKNMDLQKANEVSSDPAPFPNESEQSVEDEEEVHPEPAVV